MLKATLSVNGVEESLAIPRGRSVRNVVAPNSTSSDEDDEDDGVDDAGPPVVKTTATRRVAPVSDENDSELARKRPRREVVTPRRYLD